MFFLFLFLPLLLATGTLKLRNLFQRFCLCQHTAIPFLNTFHCRQSRGQHIIIHSPLLGSTRRDGRRTMLTIHVCTHFPLVRTHTHPHTHTEPSKPDTALMELAGIWYEIILYKTGRVWQRIITIIHDACG